MESPSRFAILGTAGHIDHGKTALVSLLTGTDTDRLKEEKLRGISIDLGFAHLDLPGGLSCGVVDVPGHERFVKNMLAGACGVDAMLLVIAADEGVMPQTREHLDILDLLGVTSGVVALTKIDMVEPDWLELVTETVREVMETRGFGGFPLVPVSSKTGEGRDAVLAALAKTMSNLEDRPQSRAARLPVDRAFVVEGFGTVVTGTLWQGTIRSGDAVVVEPGGLTTRARNVEVHGERTNEARAGQRTAVALAGVSREAVPRGTWVLKPGTLEPSFMLDIRLRVLPEIAKGIQNRQRVRFHLGASEILGRVVLLEGDTVDPGDETLAQIRLESPAVADRGDRFVIRSYSPPRAIAGGTVILPLAPKRRRGSDRVLEELHREESGSLEDRILAVLGGLPSGGTPDEIAKAGGVSTSDTAEGVGRLLECGDAIELEGGAVVAAETLAGLKDRAVGLLEEFQTANPLRWGTGRGELKSRLAKKLSPALFERVIRELIAEDRVTDKDDHFRAGDPELHLAPELQARVDRVRGELEEGGCTPPSLKELQTRQGGSVQDVLGHLTFSGEAVKVTPELYVTDRHMGSLTRWLETFFQERPQLSLAELRESWGMSRKYSVPILEYLDKQGWTRRVGDVRVPGRRLGG